MTKQHKNFDELVSNLETRADTYIFGPTGSGKSRGVLEAAKKLNLGFYKKLIGAQMTEASILGYMDAGGRYVPGIAFTPLTEGGVLLMDELDNGNSNTNLVFNGLCDREIAFPCGMRTAHKDFVLVGTANTLGTGATLEYCGRNRIDLALTNRLVFLPWNYDEELEAVIVKEEYRIWGGKDEGIIQALLNDVKQYRAAIADLKIASVIISPRTTLQAAKKFAVGRNPIEILRRVLLKGIDNELAKKIHNHSKDVKLVQNFIDENKAYLRDILSDETKRSILLNVDLEKNPFPTK